jgi:hypothetical protein
MLAGLYHAASYMVNTIKLELKAGAPHFESYANN